MTAILAALQTAPYYSVSISDSTFHAYSGIDVTAFFTFAAAGTYSGTGNGSSSFNTSGTWLYAGQASGLEIRVTQNSGDAVSGTLNSWLPLSSDRTWSLSRLTNGTNSGVLTVTIRNASTWEELDSATVILIAENE